MKSNIRLICFFKLIACITICAPSLSLAQTEICNYKNKSTFVFRDLVELIKNPACEVKSIKDVISKLPSFMSKNTVLMNRSQSLQGPHKVDYVYPRAIVNSLGSYDNHQAGIALSFNGHASQTNYLGLEVMAVDITKDFNTMFEYADIQFPSESESETLTWSEIQNRIKFSEKNPATCQKCHGNPARPIFEQYPNLDGALGKRHIEKLSNQENEGFDKFIAMHKNDRKSRYYWLNLEKFFGSTTLPRTIDPTETVFDRGTQNLEFNQRLFNYNAYRVAKMIQSKKMYSVFKYAIWGASSDCDNIKEFFPEQIFHQLKKNAVVNLDTNTNIQALKNTFPYPGPNDFGGGKGSETLFDDEDLFRLWYDTAAKQGKDRLMPNGAFVRLIFEGQGLNINSFWMDLNQPSYRMNSGAGETWKYAFLDLDPEFKLLIGKADYTEHSKNASCSQLAKLSHTAFANYSVSAISKSQPNQQNPVDYPAVFLNTCIKCHDSDYNVGPRIPFGNQSEFKMWIHTNENKNKILYKIAPSTKVGKMPPTRELLQAEREMISNYVKSH